MPDRDQPLLHARKRRRILGWLAGTGALGPAVLSGRAWAQGLPPGTQGLREVQGEVRVNGVLATTGGLVRSGDTVTTGAASRAAFVVGQDAFLLRAGSRAEFSGRDLVLDLVRLLTGKLLGVYAGREGKRLETPSATIGIRGTAAYLEADDERTYFCLCYGSAEVATASGNSREAYTTTHHESPRYIYGDNRSQPIVPAGVANHTDAELMMLEGLVWRTPPRTFMESPVRY